VTYLGPKEFVRSAERDHPWSYEQALSYTRWLATSHYENFHVVSFLLPKRLHQDFYNIYAFCRWADDLGDEIGDKQESLALLAWWREQLEDMFRGRASHPVFVALARTAQQYDLPAEPFDHLIRAFEQDQVVSRYPDWDGILEYCRYSANPVGRLILMLCGYRDTARFEMSDATCTALQLANHWQDVTVDLLKDRVYIPLDIIAKHGYSVEKLFAREFTPEFAAVMRDIVDRARLLFWKGLPLAGTVDRRLAVDLDLFSRGGQRVLDKIEQQNYDVLARRPAISKMERAGLLMSSILRRSLQRAAAA